MSPSVTVRLLATQSDARLVELARQGHERAFEALVQRHRRPLLAYCRRALLPDGRAEDALQQALLHAWLALQRDVEVRDVRAWLYRIVHNAALNARRGSGYDYAELSEALSGAGAPQEDLDRRIAVREALAGLAALPEQQRKALLRTAVEGASHADAAAEMGLSEGALRGLVYRARAALRTALTGITPMPLATWVAGAAGHGGPAVAELAVGGGSAGLAALLAKGGAVALTAGALAVGAGTVERHHRPAPARAAAHPHRAARDDASRQTAPLAAAAAPVLDPAAGDPPASTRRGTRHPQRRIRRRRARVAAPERSPDASAVPIHPRRDGDDDGAAGESPRHGRAEHDGGRGDGGPGPGGRHGGERLPGTGRGPPRSGERHAGDGENDPVRASGDGDGDRSVRGDHSRPGDRARSGDDGDGGPGDGDEGSGDWGAGGGSSAVPGSGDGDGDGGAR